MHPKIKETYRNMLKELLTQCTEAQQMVFKRMYSHKNLELDINTVVDNMDESKYDWAIIQCGSTIAQNNAAKANPLVAIQMTKTLNKSNESTGNSPQR